MHLGSKSPIYDVILLAHIVCAIGGFGANGLAGLYAGQLAPSPSDGAIKYFSASKFYAEKLIYLIPVFGLIMIAVSRGVSELGEPWVIFGISAWVIAVGVAHSLVWPNERRISALIESDDNLALRKLGKKVSVGAMLLDVIFVVTFIVMLTQPGGK